MAEERENHINYQSNKNTKNTKNNVKIEKSTAVCKQQKVGLSIRMHLLILEGQNDNMPTWWDPLLKKYFEYKKCVIKNILSAKTHATPKQTCKIKYNTYLSIYLPYWLIYVRFKITLEMRSSI